MAFAILPEEILFSDLNVHRKVLMAAVIFYTTNTQKAVSDLSLSEKLGWSIENTKKELAQLVNKNVIALTPEGYISTWPGLSINMQVSLATKIVRKSKEKIELPFPSEAHECLAIWEKYCPLHKKANPALSLKTISDLNRIERLSWERIKRIVAYAAAKWGTKGYMMTPAALRDLTRAGDVPKWVAMEQQMGIFTPPKENLPSTSKLIPG